MCLEDYRIMLATKSYIRRVQIAGAAVQVLPQNPRRVGIVIPAKLDQLVGWSHSNVLQSGVLSSTYLTGQDLVTVTGGPYPAIFLSLFKHGDLVRMPLFAWNFTGSTFFQVVETLLDYDVDGLDLSQGVAEPYTVTGSVPNVQ